MIGQFIGSLDSGGAENVVLNLTKYYIKNNIDTIVICREGSWIINECIKNNIPFIPFSYNMERFWNSKLVPIYVYYLCDFLKEHKIKILHSHLYKATLYNSLSCWKLNIHHVATQHDIYSITEKPSRKKWLKCVDKLGTKLVAVSSTFLNIYDLNMSVIHNGIESLPILDNSKKEYRKKLTLSAFNCFDTETFVISSVGRLIPLKRFDLLFKSLYYLRTQFFIDNVILLLMGDGPEIDYLQKLAKKLKINVKFIGHVQDVNRYLEISNIFILPSETEGLSLSIIEALNNGLPIIAFNVGGNRELVRDKLNGCLLERKEYNDDEIMDLCYSIRELYLLNQSSDSLKEMGKRSKSLFNKFTIVNMANLYLDLYNIPYYKNYLG